MAVLSGLAVSSLVISMAMAAQTATPRVVLTGWAQLPAETFRAGVAAGRGLPNPAQGLPTPFMGQPVQGFSGLLADGSDGVGRSRFLALSDNGFGGQSNSYDFVLAWHRLTVDWNQRSVSLNGVVELSDPERRLGFPAVADRTTWPTRDLPVDSRVTSRRLLTGYDLDPESFRRLGDGTIWVGDEFGPYLLKVNAQGQLLAAPVSIPNPLATTAGGTVNSPQRPGLVGGTANLPGSGGVEGMALDADGKTLWASLERAITGDPLPERRWVQGYDTSTGTWSGKPWAIRLDAATHAIGDLTAVGPGRFVMLERDSEQGESARVKRVYLVDSRQPDAEGFARKTLVADLLRISDPDDLNRDGLTDFTFPFVTIESVVVENPRSLVLCNDNNFPARSPRRPGLLEATEFIRLRLPEPLP